MLAVEALFKIQSKEIKDQILSNYNLGNTDMGLVEHGGKQQDL